MKKIRLKVIALGLLNVLLFELIAPTVSYALTSGPGQPEFQGFTEVDISQSVDPFTGDFSYQIPLLVVPGPNGGYPLNLTYSSGVGMEEEASWVGLGWSLTPGAINRSVRGIPDDFIGPTDNDKTNYDYIKQTKYLKPNFTAMIGVSPKFSFEVFGAELDLGLSANFNYYYNSYTGFGFRHGVNLGLNAAESSGGKAGLGLGLNFDPADGPSVQPSLSLSVKDGDTDYSTSIGMGYSSRQGVTGFNFSNSMKKGYTRTDGKQSSRTLRSSSISYSGESGVPTINFPTKGFNAGFQIDIETGAAGTHFDIPIGFTGNFSFSQTDHYLTEGYKFPAFGTMYSEHRYKNDNIENDRALMDFNLENEGPISEKTPILAMPVLTHDIYQITGDGLGGAFRAYRNDAGIFYKPKATNVNVGVNIGVELAASTGFKIGVDPNVTFSKGYSGKWRDGDQAAMNMMGFRKAGDFDKNGVRRNEPYTFRFPNEFLPNFEGEISYKNIGNSGPGLVNIHNTPASFDDFANSSDFDEDEDASETIKKNKVFKDMLIVKAKTQSSVNGIHYSSNMFINREPRRRMNLIQYYTFNEMQKFNYPEVKNIFAGSYSSPKSLTFEKYTVPSYSKGHHVKGFHVLKPDGSHAIYDTPLYNTVQKEIFFSISGQMYYQASNPSAQPAKIISYNPSILSDKRGQTGTSDRMYTEAETSPYVHTYLLSYVTSADYIDIDGDGPSNEDFGYWAKFNYFKYTGGINNYKWRMPFESNKANYSSGSHSNPDDDKASISYGEKEQTFLHSIETKTHVAFFYLSDRNDAIGVNGINGGSSGTGSAKMKKLDKIELYSKNDLSTPLKTVHFRYEDITNELCQGIPNKLSSGLGKLTLKEVWFTYKNSTKGEQAKYSFNYGNVYKTNPANGYLIDSTIVNKPYSYVSVDRWGTYSSNSDPENPYTNQSLTPSGESERKEASVTWNLTKIKLPTGAVIRVDYEMDDYSHVQNFEATQMVKIIGTGRYNDAAGIELDFINDGKSSIRDDDQLIFFEPVEPISNTLSHTEKMKIIESYVSGLKNDQIYFKVWEKLQRRNNVGEWMADYVTGYGQLKKIGNKPVVGYITPTGSNVSLPYIVLDNADNKAKHHFRAAGLQYLRYTRTDLNRPSFSNNNSPDPGQIILGLFQVIPQLTELIAGYYKTSIWKGYCADLLSTKPSYLRLNNPNKKKFGGGIRVKKLTVSDEWNVSGLNASQYGSEYYYKMEDGSSSGVATYEPMLGNDENPMKNPSFYGPDNKFSNNDKAFFMESPIGESYFPGASVGYRRVVISNIANNVVRKTGDGINVKEFFTAKEFPIKAEYNKQPQVVKDKFDFMLPLIGSVSMKAYGYSQGFFIELNDMHGKPKAEYAYDRDSWDPLRKDIVNGAEPTGYSLNKYQTQAPYNPNGNNELDSKIEVIDKFGNVYERIVGDVSEFFGNMSEDFSYSVSAGVGINAGLDVAPYIPFASVFPQISYTENSARVISTTKVVNKVGVLHEVVTYKDGVLQKSRNIYYDEETAQPILTAITDDYDNPLSDENNREIFTMQYPAHWYYSGMESAYKNYRLRFKGNINNIPQAKRYFEAGDMVHQSGTLYHVDTVLNNSIKLVNPTGSVIDNLFGDFVIVKSGKKNLQSTAAGKLVSLENPMPIISVSDLHQSFKNGYDNLVANDSIIGNSDSSSFQLDLFLGEYKRCNGQKLYLGVYIKDNQWVFVVTTDVTIMKEICVIIYNFSLPSGIKLKDVSFDILHNKKIEFRYPGSLSGITVDPQMHSCNLNLDCIKGVLHADATEYSDKWIYRNEFTESLPSSFTNSNEFRKGERGIWRMKRANTYFTERLQYDVDSVGQFGKTFIGYDGTYRVFVPFDWQKTYNNLLGNQNNIQAENGWRWAAEIPKNGYSPYGFEIENVNALGIYSSALYGYKNSLVSMTAQNAAYQEIGFNGFEEPYLSSLVYAVTYSSGGHLNFETNYPTISVMKSTSHTGLNSLSVFKDIYLRAPVYANVNSFNSTDQLQLIKGKSYTISFWYKINDESSWTAELVNDSTLVSYYSMNFTNSQNKIEGWSRFECSFKIPTGLSDGEYVKFLMSSPNNNGMFIDDFRIHPTNSAVNTYVYHPINYQFKAQLDDNNYATFYNYDEEDNLSQVKKETERGIMTIQQTRKNVKN